MISRQRTVDAARDEILAAIDELRTVSMADRDEQRRHVAEQLHALFVGITEKRTLREAARGAWVCTGAEWAPSRTSVIRT